MVRPKHSYNLLVVLGPTASGKTRLGARLAALLGGEIISADSRQVYRQLDIGSGKDLEDYRVGDQRVPYHLIDVTDISQQYSVYHFQRQFQEVFQKLKERGILPVMVGGTGLYLEAVLLNYPLIEVAEDLALRAELARLSDDTLEKKLRALPIHLHNDTHLATRNRMIRALEIAILSQGQQPKSAPVLTPLVLGIQWERPALRVRITERLRARLQNGLVEEVEGLHAQGVPWERLQALGLEYRYVSDFLTGKITNRNDLAQKLAAAIWQFAKRQETWFRRMERRGIEIHWIPGADTRQADTLVRSVFST